MVNIHLQNKASLHKWLLHLMFPSEANDDSTPPSLQDTVYPIKGLTLLASFTVPLIDVAYVFKPPLAFFSCWKLWECDRSLKQSNHVILFVHFKVCFHIPCSYRCLVLINCFEEQEDMVWSKEGLSFIVHWDIKAGGISVDAGWRNHGEILIISSTSCVCGSRDIGAENTALLCCIVLKYVRTLLTWIFQGDVLTPRTWQSVCGSKTFLLWLFWDKYAGLNVEKSLCMRIDVKCAWGRFHYEKSNPVNRMALSPPLWWKIPHSNLIFGKAFAET